MNLLCFAVVGTLLVILQTTLLMPSPVWVFAPDLYFVFVAYLAVSRFSWFSALLLVYLTGLMLDVLSGPLLGMYSLICFAGFACIRPFAGRVVCREFFYSIPLIAIIFLALSALAYVIFDFIHPASLAPWVWWEMGVRALLVAVFVWPLFRLLDMVYNYGENSVAPWKRLRARSTGPRRRQT